MHDSCRRLKLVKNYLSLTYADVAAALHVDPMSVYGWIRGRRPTPVNRERLDRYLVEMEELMFIEADIQKWSNKKNGPNHR